MTEELKYDYAIRLEKIKDKKKSFHFNSLAEDLKIELLILIVEIILHK